MLNTRVGAEMSSRLLLAVLVGATLLIIIALWASTANETRAQTTILEYVVTGDEFSPTGGGDPWLITGGSMSLELYDILPQDSLQRAVYAVTGFSIEVVEPSGTVHTFTVVPDGLPSPFFSAGGIPDSVQDSGIFNVFSDGFLDMMIYDLSIDEQAVDQQDMIGGPAFVGSSWTGTFPEMSSFSVTSLVALPSLSFSGAFSLGGTKGVTPTPVPGVTPWGLLALASAMTAVTAVLWSFRRRSAAE